MPVSDALKLSFIAPSGMVWGELLPPPRNVLCRGAGSQGGGYQAGSGCPSLNREVLGDGIEGSEAQTHCESFCAPQGGGDLGDSKCFPPLMSPRKRLAS